jgi:hypothetical protein
MQNNHCHRVSTQLQLINIIIISLYKLLGLSHVIFQTQIRDNSPDGPKRDADVQPELHCT